MLDLHAHTRTKSNCRYQGFIQNDFVENQGIARSQELKSLRGKNVLVIDDQEDITRSLKMALENEGLQVTVYNDPCGSLTTI